ncbi:MAG TPA: hypothetical protein VN684_12205 [Terriglobales bacterium]|nr:hypothetical protein [Terriglobales bacterium]
MNKSKICFHVSLLALIFLFSFAAQAAAQAEDFSSVAVFAEPGFPAADAVAPSSSQLESLLPGARFAALDQLAARLKDSVTRTLVLPYGSAFPEQAWPGIFKFLQHGGNLVVLGGRPFTRSAYRDANGWHLRPYSVRFIRPLMIDQYQSTPGSEGMEFQDNPDITLKLPRFSWKQAFSPVIRLSAVDLYHRGGAAGSLDARLDALAWGVKARRKLSAPAIEVDHIRNGFDGGRWIFVNAELGSDFYSNTDAIRALVSRAENGSEEFTVRPVMPLYLPGEPIQLDISSYSATPAHSPMSVKITLHPDGQTSRSATTINLPITQSPELPAPQGKGLYIIDAQLMEGDTVRAIYHSGFWIRDEEFLRSGAKLTVNHDYFELDGHPLAVIGTTYMSSETQRLFFERPNVYVWNQDLAQIHSAGLNMIRTGWWTGWDKFFDENGTPYERTLRTMEAYLMTARKNALPVQFNFFAFLPDTFAGGNPYLDPQVVRKQQTLISAVVGRFHDVPWLAWDLINEPSISQYLWKTRPNGDPIELQKWNEWLNKRYPDKAALAAAWNVPAAEVSGTVSLPEEVEFGQRDMYVGRNSLKIYDYYAFAQDSFDGWIQAMVDAARATGSKQLITLGQDEGGIQDRLSPAYWGKLVNFTTNHSWWLNDTVLWDSLFAKQPDEAMLIQETGLQRELNMDEIARRTPENEAALLERKIATSFVQGSGAIEWLWNSNSYMTESNETPIGAVRPDSTEKPEATVLRDFATFAGALSPHLQNPELPSIAIVTSQAAQYSPLGDQQLAAQQTAARALVYYDHLTAYAIAENQIDKLGSPKLAILPSPQALMNKSWSALLDYVKAGGNLLITGPVGRDEHWQRVDREADIKANAQLEPLTYHGATITAGTRKIDLNFNLQDQNVLESLHFSDGATLKEISYGKGRVFWAAYPVELAGERPSADLYSYVAGRVGLAPSYDVQGPLPSSVMVFPINLQDSMMYVFASDNATDTGVDLRDKLTGARLTFRLPSQHAAIAVISKQQKSVIAKYGF